MSNYNDEEKLELMVQGEIFQQLLQSERFLTFFNANFDLQKHVDEENKSITFKLLEVPPEVTLSRLQGREDAAQESAPMIESVSSVEWQKLEKKLERQK
jgi:hypothetical protein